ncbi:MAG: hypothetical protein ABJE95_08920 [Byssovorax sp.]
MRKLVCFLVALAFSSGCHTPAPFDAGTDCPKEAYCGQCASRGGCAWCGDPEGSSKGRCVAVGQHECAAPAAWAKTPDRCPPPPAATVAPVVTASTSASPSPVARAIGPDRYQAIRSALQHAFPQATVTDDVVDGAALVLQHGPPPGAAPGPPTATPSSIDHEVAPLTRHVVERDHRLYLGYATHHRVKSAPPAGRPMESEFTLPLPMVRVTLPDALAADGSILATEIGDVDLSHDHLLGSVDLLNAKYGGAGYLGSRPERVDLITPPRSGGSRFAAIAVYLGFRHKADRAPSFYLLEAGTATGDAKMIYFSPDMKPIDSVTSYYLPTPFVTMANTYSGGITMLPAPSEDEPDQLVIQSRSPGEKDPYITVTLKYRRALTLDLPLPIEITVDAGARVALIAKAMGIASAVELQPVLADLARTLHWQEVPRYVEPAAGAR